jgi:hypothetical protein
MLCLVNVEDDGDEADPNYRDMTSVTGRYTMHVIDHLQDIATPGASLSDETVQALHNASDSEDLICRLLDLVSANPPVLAHRTHMRERAGAESE